MCFLSRVYCHLSWSTHCLHFRILILCFWPRQKMETKAAAVAVAAVAAVVAPAAQAAASTEIVGSLFTPPTIHQVREHPQNTHRSPPETPLYHPLFESHFYVISFHFFCCFICWPPLAFTFPWALLFCFLCDCIFMAVFSWKTPNLHIYFLAVPPGSRLSVCRGLRIRPVF